VRLAGDVDGAFHQGKLRRFLAAPHLVHERRRIRHAGWIGGSTPPFPARAVQRPREPWLHQALVFEAGEQGRSPHQQTRQKLGELVDGTSLIDAQSCRALHSESLTIPDFALGILGSEEEHAARSLSADEHERCIRLVEAGEVMEIRALPEFMADVVISQGRQRGERHQHAPVQLREQSSTPTDERREINHDVWL
jgi:hypothetical protein